MARIYEADGAREFKMDWKNPHVRLEPIEDERAAVDGGLRAMANAGILPSADYSEEKLLAHRTAVEERFDIPWTAIGHRMQRLIYGINATAQPQVMVAVGIFCGNTFISNAGAAIGPGACYRARRLVGLEIREEEADRARRNVATFDDGGTAQILGEDGIPWLEKLEDTVDLLYLDADGSGGRGKSIYLEVLQAAEHRMRRGTLVLAHNSVNSASQLGDYLAYVRDPARYRESMNVVVDNQGLEVTMR